FSYNGGFKWNPDNVIRQKAYELVDASLTYAPVDHDNWQGRLWGKNITNEKYMSFVLEQAGPAGFSYSPAPPATYRVERRYRLDAPRSSCRLAAGRSPRDQVRQPAQAPAGPVVRRVRDLLRDAPCGAGGGASARRPALRAALPPAGAAPDRRLASGRL